VSSQKSGQSDGKRGVIRLLVVLIGVFFGASGLFLQPLQRLQQQSEPAIGRFCMQ
jgi:CHASE3 domain sensor protein